MSFKKFFQQIRVIKYKLLSDCKNMIGSPKFHQPTQLIGEGTIVFGENVHLGFFPSPYYYNGYIYIEARNKNTKIIFGDNIHINNNCVFIAEGDGIEIGSDSLIGTNCEIIDSDFHDLHPDKRSNSAPTTAKVTIGKNVFIGNNVKILKGIHIGDNTIIANGSIVVKSIAENLIAGGNPAKIIKNLS